MYSPESLKELVVTIQAIKNELNGTAFEKVTAAKEAYRELLDDFYEEYQDMMASEQYEKAKNKPDYFICLINLAYHDQTMSKPEKYRTGLGLNSYSNGAL